jgi:spore coat protein CotF
MTAIATSLTLTPENRDWLKDHCISATLLLRAAIKERREKEVDMNETKLCR